MPIVTSKIIYISSTVNDLLRLKLHTSNHASNAARDLLQLQFSKRLLCSDGVEYKEFFRAYFYERITSKSPMSTICMTGPDLKIIATEGEAQAKVADTLGGMDHVPHSIKSKIKHLHELTNESMCSSVIKLTMIHFFARRGFFKPTQRKAVEAAPRQQMLK